MYNLPFPSLKIIVSIGLMALLGLQGCVQDSEQIEPITSHESSSDLDLTNAVRQEEDMIQLGEQLTNPYTITNMQAAYESLITSNAAYDVGLSINTSHRYVRFLPESELQRNELLSDSSVEFFDYPLDYEIGENGTYYHDPTLPDSQPTWQYAVFPISKPLPEVPHEILAELYLPELFAEEGREPLLLEIPNLLEDLVDEALRLTGNLEDDDSAGKTAAASWNPSGRIRVYDDEVGGFIPLAGAKVRARRWFIVKTDRADQNGDYQTGSFRRAVNYSIKWEHKDYDIRRGHWAQAYYNGPKLDTDWDLDIAAGATASYHIAHIHRAAERYFFGNTGGLKRPNVWTRLKISYIAGQGGGVNWGQNWQLFLTPPLLIPNGGLIPNMKIWGYYGSGAAKPSRLMFATTIHEIAHSSHIELMTWGIFSYGQVESRLYESWATCVEWYLTDLEYDNLGISNYGDPNVFTTSRRWLHYQRWSPSAHGSGTTYTPMYIDMVDTYNQSLNEGTPPTNRCPNGGTFDGANCYVGTPPSGESAFIWSNNYYYTPEGASGCPYPGSNYDGANCFVSNIPSNTIGFIWNNKWYYHPAGDSDYPYDQVSGYTMSTLESQVVKNAYGHTSLKQALKQNKPVGMTDRHIDVYFSYY